MRVQILSGRFTEEVEDCVNEWLAEHQNTIVYHVLQSVSASAGGEWLTISIWYQEEAANEPTQAD